LQFWNAVRSVRGESSGGQWSSRINFRGSTTALGPYFQDSGRPLKHGHVG
jgi:hypothetical protein